MTKEERIKRAAKLYRSLSKADRDKYFSGKRIEKQVKGKVGAKVGTAKSYKTGRSARKGLKKLM
jgi:hypothetical protein